MNDGVEAQKLIDENNDHKPNVTILSCYVIAWKIWKLHKVCCKKKMIQKCEPNFETELGQTQHLLETYRLEQLLDEPYDANNAIFLEIHPGPGAPNHRIGVQCY